jgi:NAD(P)H-hydrate epimerase
MKIFTAAQIRACDAYTIHASNITSLQLMERAAGKCADWLAANLPKDTLFVVLCGSGNNGGDGLVITRLLHYKGFGVKAFVLRLGNSFSDDCRANLERLQRMDSNMVTIMEPDTYITDIPQHIVIIDAILGTGLSRPVEGWPAQFISHINQLPNRKVAIDIPSGLPADNIPSDDAVVLKAEDTLSFQFYKRTFLHPETGVYAGNVHLLDIGLNEVFISSTHTQYQATDSSLIKEIYKPRSPFAHKGTYGHAQIVAGSYGKMGAAVLSANAALHAGAGLVSTLIPECGYNIMQTAVPEVMCETSGAKEIENIAANEKMNAVGIGPGLGTSEKTAKALASFIENSRDPLVLDADALNIISSQPELLNKIPAHSIITPHPKEFTRLFGERANSMLQLELARTQAMRYNINIVLKGHYTVVITTEGDCWYNTTGNAGMATGGAGDVLTGIITGLLAQKYEPKDAAILGVYLHGLAGDIAAKELSQEALKAGDIITHLGTAFLSLND